MNWLLKNLKTLIVDYREILLLIACALLILFIILRPGPAPVIHAGESPSQLKAVEILKDANDKLYAKLKQAVVSEAMVKKERDSLAKALKVKPRYIKGVETTVTKTKVEIKEVPTPIYVKGDTAYKVEKHDSWIDVVAVAGKDTGSISIIGRDTLTRTEVVKTPLFGPTTRYIALRNASKYNTIEQGASWTIKEKEPVVVIGPSVTWTPFGNNFVFGVSAVIPIIKIKK